MITPMDIHNKTFSRQIRGYSSDEVDGFLAELAGDYEKIYREHRVMEEEMDAIRTKLRNYEKMEKTMSSTLVMAQETAENVRKNAHREAELSLTEARNEAEKIVAAAEVARRKMNSDLLKTEGDVNLYIEKLLSNFKSALALIEAAKAVAAPKPIENHMETEAPKAEPKAEEAAPAVEEAPVEEKTEQEVSVEEAKPEETSAEEGKEEAAEEATPATEMKKEASYSNDLFSEAAANVKVEEKN